MRIASLAIGFFLFFSCTSNKSCKECTANPEKDTITEQPQESLEAALIQDKSTAPTKEQKENHEKIVKKYGEQWDFCSCIVANDSINDAFEKGNMTPAQEEKLMARWEYVDTKCKELTTAPSTTPEERAIHDKKVMKCLKENGLKK